MNLDQALQGQAQTVKCVVAPVSHPELGRQLEEIGFVPGEQVTILQRSYFGGDPMLVRVGASSFALRSSEAKMVQLDIPSTNE